MYYIMDVYTSTCMVKDTTDGVVEELSKDYILECIKKGVTVQGYSPRFGFYPVVPTSKDKCHYIGDLWRGRDYDAYIIPFSTKARKLARMSLSRAFAYGDAYESSFSSGLGEDANKVKVIRAKRDTWTDKEVISVEDAIFIGVTSDGRYGVQIDGYVEELRALILGYGLPLEYDMVKYNMSRLKTFLGNLKTYISRFEDTRYSVGSVAPNLSSSEFITLLLQEITPTATEYNIVDVGVTISTGAVRALCGRLFDYEYVSQYNIIDEPQSISEDLSKFLSFLASCEKAVRVKESGLSSFIISGELEPVCTHLSIVKGVPTLHYISIKDAKISSVSLVDFLSMKTTLSLLDTDLDEEDTIFHIKSLVGRYTVNLPLLLEDFNLVATAETKKTALRSLLSGRGICEIAGDGTLLSCEEDKRHSINIPEGVTKLGMKSVLVTGETRRFEFPSSLKEVSEGYLSSKNNEFVSIPINDIEIVFKSSSVKAFKGVLNGLLHQSLGGVYANRAALFSLDNLALRESNLNAVFTGLLCSEDKDVLFTSNLETSLSKLDKNDIADALYGAISTYCKTSRLSANNFTISVPMLKRAIKFYRGNNRHYEELPLSLHMLTPVGTPVKTEYQRFEDASALYRRFYDFLSGTAKYALKDFLDKLEHDFTKYTVNYRQYLMDAGFYSSAGDLIMINAVRYIKSHR